MASVQKSVLVPYGAERMFELVERIEDYPRFLPWCGGATILERTPAETLARRRHPLNLTSGNLPTRLRAGFPT